MSTLQQDILRLDIPVDHAEAVRVPERIRHFAGDEDRITHRQLAFTYEARPQRFARDERHDIVQQTIRLTRIEQRQDVRMLQARRGADFAQEPVPAEGGAQIGMQDLDGDVAVVLDVVGEVYGRHPAGAKFALDRVAAGEGRGERRQAITQARPLFRGSSAMGDRSNVNWRIPKTSRNGGLRHCRRGPIGFVRTGRAQTLYC